MSQTRTLHTRCPLVRGSRVRTRVSMADPTTRLTWKDVVDVVLGVEDNHLNPFQADSTIPCASLVRALRVARRRRAQTKQAANAAAIGIILSELESVHAAGQPTNPVVAHEAGSTATTGVPEDGLVLEAAIRARRTIEIELESARKKLEEDVARVKADAERLEKEVAAAAEAMRTAKEAKEVEEARLQRIALEEEQAAKKKEEDERTAARAAEEAAIREASRKEEEAAKVAKLAEERAAALAAEEAKAAAAEALIALQAAVTQAAALEEMARLEVLLQAQLPPSRSSPPVVDTGVLAIAVTNGGDYTIQGVTRVVMDHLRSTHSLWHRSLQTVLHVVDEVNTRLGESTKVANRLPDCLGFPMTEIDAESVPELAARLAGIEELPILGDNEGHGLSVFAFMVCNGAAIALYTREADTDLVCGVVPMCLLRAHVTTALKSRKDDANAFLKRDLPRNGLSATLRTFVRSVCAVSASLSKTHKPVQCRQVSWFRESKKARTLVECAIGQHADIAVSKVFTAGDDTTAWVLNNVGWSTVAEVLCIALRDGEWTKQQPFPLVSIHVTPGVDV
jgi:hypothetical protein